jgi:hypothetical protein
LFEPGLGLVTIPHASAEASTFLISPPLCTIRISSNDKANPIEIGDLAFLRFIVLSFLQDTSSIRGLHYKKASVGVVPDL